MRVGTQRGPDRIASTLQRWRDAGLAVRVTSLEYDPSTDYVDESAVERERMRMQRVQRGPGEGGDESSSGSEEGGEEGEDASSGGSDSKWQQKSGRKMMMLPRGRS